MRPSETLRSELEHHRERGHPFRVAWPVVTSAALADLPPSSQVEWRTIFGETKRVWMLSYSRQPWPASKRGSMFVPDDEHTGVRGDQELVA